MHWLKQGLKVFIYFVFLGLFVRLGIGLFSSFHLSFERLPAYFFGLHFDLAAAGLFSIIWGLGSLLGGSSPWWQKLWLGLLTASYFVISATDYIYIQESGRHLGYEVQNLLSISGSLIDLLAKYSPFVLMTAAMTLTLVWRFPVLKTQPKGFFKKSFLYLFYFVPNFICVRGFEGIPLDPSYAYRAGSTIEANIALNPVYSVVYSGLSGKQAKIEEMDLPEGLDTEAVFKEWRNGRGVAAPLYNHESNVVIVFLEGWTTLRETPYFSQLQRDSLTTELFVAGGHRTVEGMFSTLCGWTNPHGRGIMFSQLENMDYDCLPQRLREKGYHTAFFQGSDQLTSGVGPLAQKLGFSESFGKNDLPGAQSKEKNFWGLFDKDLYQYVIDHIQEHKEPFLIGINTNTTHDLKLPQGVDFRFGEDTLENQHRSVVIHADEELKFFVESLKALPLKKPLTLVLVADHTSYIDGSYLNHYSIPFAIHSPLVEAQKISGVFTQKDVASTLADLLGVPAPHYLGLSLLRPSAFKTGADIYHLGSTVWFENEWAVVFNIRKANQFKCYLWRNDWNLQNQKPCPEEAQEMYQRGVSYFIESQKYLFSNQTQIIK